MLPDAKRRAQRTWGSSPTGWTAARGAEPGTQEFFERAMKYRSEHEQPWLPTVIPFQEMSGRRVLEIGFGPGYDALTLLQHGAIYSGIDITPENIVRTKRHLEPLGYDPDVRLGDAENLEFPDAVFDVVYSNGVLHHTPDIGRAFSEARRVLKPGGSFFVILYHRNSLFHRVSLTLSGLVRGETAHHRLQRIEANAAGETPIVNVYSRRDLARMLAGAGFEVQFVTVRKLTWEDLPGAKRLEWLYRRIPRRVLSAVERFAGWYVIAHCKRT